jgi:hypothetical protein
MVVKFRNGIIISNLNPNTSEDCLSLSYFIRIGGGGRENALNVIVFYTIPQKTKSNL